MQQKIIICYHCHGKGTIDRVMFGPGEPVAALHKTDCPTCFGQGRLVELKWETTIPIITSNAAIIKADNEITEILIDLRK